MVRVLMSVSGEGVNTRILAPLVASSSHSIFRGTANASGKSSTEGEDFLRE